MKNRLSLQSGFNLITAIFVLVVLSLAAAFIVSAAAKNISTSNFSLLGHRAYFAAVSGAEWGLHQAIVSNTCTASENLSLTQAGLSGFSVNVSCTSSNYTEGVTVYQVFQITSIATRGNIGEVDYASRTVEVKATRGI